MRRRWKVPRGERPLFPFFLICHRVQINSAATEWKKSDSFLETRPGPRQCQSIQVEKCDILLISSPLLWPWNCRNTCLAWQRAMRIMRETLTNLRQSCHHVCFSRVFQSFRVKCAEAWHVVRNAYYQRLFAVWTTFVDKCHGLLAFLSPALLFPSLVVAFTLLSRLSSMAKVLSKRLGDCFEEKRVLQIGCNLEIFLFVLSLLLS